MDKIVIRIDFSDEGAWQRALSVMEEPWGGEFESTSYVVNDRDGEGATIEQILDAAQHGDTLSVVFVADAQTMTSVEHTLLVVNLDETANHMDEGYDVEHGTTFGRHFRVLPKEASGIQVNVALANMDYEEWADAATRSADGVFRGF